MSYKIYFFIFYLTFAAEIEPKMIFFGFCMEGIGSQNGNELYRLYIKASDFFLRMGKASASFNDKVYTTRFMLQNLCLSMYSCDIFWQAPTLPSIIPYIPGLKVFKFVMNHFYAANHATFCILNHCITFCCWFQPHLCC